MLSFPAFTLHLQASWVLSSWVLSPVSPELQQLLQGDTQLVPGGLQ